jgi:alpha-D-ribose 1-methylphosphonate 5-phosphate C-P lyase
MIRRAILKGIAIPGLPGALRLARDADALWLGHRRRAGDGGDHRPDDTLKVIDQGADDTTNAVSIRKFFAKTAGVATTTSHGPTRRSSRPATAFPKRR